MAVLLLAGLATACERAPIRAPDPEVSILSETVGSGEPVVDGVVACISYRVTFPDGRVLMEDDETCLTVGGGTVIDGISQALEGMREGGRRRVKMPPHTHWGSTGHGPIPPGTTLGMVIEVLSVHPPGWRPEPRSTFDRPRPTIAR